MNVLKELCKEGAVDGMLHDSDGGSGALFTPTVHIHQQRRAVDSLFQSQGYLTARQAKSFGLTESTFVSFVKKSFVSVPCLACLLATFSRLMCLCVCSYSITPAGCQRSPKHHH